MDLKEILNNIKEVYNCGENIIAYLNRIEEKDKNSLEKS